jgi:PKD repeat protein
MSANAASCHWIFQGGNPATSTDFNPANVCYYTPGDFDVTLIVENNYGTDTMFLDNYIHVVQSPLNIVITQSNDSLFVPTGFTSYEWYFNGDPILSSSDYFTVPMLTGEYFVIAYDVNGCSTNAQLDYIVNSVRPVDDLSSAVSVFPNPAGDNFVIHMNSLESQKPVTISIFDQLSKLVIKEQIIPSSTEVNYVVNSTSMKPGIYWIRVMNGDKMVRKSIVISK